MTSPISSPDTQNSAPSKRRKAKAVIAAGTVLGIGAMVTFATWNDSEFALGEFGASSYNVQSSANGSDFDDHPESTAATLDFHAEDAAPGDQFAASFWLRTDETTTIDGLITGISSQGGGDQPGNYDVKVSVVGEKICASGTDLGDPLTKGTLSKLDEDNFPTVELPQGGEGAGEAVELCFQVTAANERLEQSKDASATWTVVTQSVEQQPADEN